MSEDEEWMFRTPLMLTAVRGLSLGPVLDRWGVSHAEPTMIPVAKAQRLALAASIRQESVWVYGASRGIVSLLWETGTVEGLRPEVLSAVTGTGGEALAICSSPEAGASLSYARNGSVALMTSALAPGDLSAGNPGFAAELSRADVDLKALQIPACVRLLRNMFDVDSWPPVNEDVVAAEVRPYAYAAPSSHPRRLADNVRALRARDATPLSPRIASAGRPSSVRRESTARARRPEPPRTSDESEEG